MCIKYTHGSSASQRPPIQYVYRMEGKEDTPKKKKKKYTP